MCLHRPKPYSCTPLSPVPGKVCGKDIEDQCGGKCIVWAADPDCGRQREDHPWAKRSGVGAGVSGKGRGTRGTLVCPSLSLSEQVS